MSEPELASARDVSAGAQLTVTIAVDRQAKAFVPTTKIGIVWQNRSTPSDDLTGSDYMVPLGNPDGSAAGEIKTLDATLADLLHVALDATDKAMQLAQLYEAARPAKVEQLMALLQSEKTPDQLRAELERQLEQIRAITEGTAPHSP